MSNSATARTSTTASSTSSASNPAIAPAQPGGCGNGPPITGPLPQPSAGQAGGKVPGGAGRKVEAGGEIEVVACGALAGHIREIASRRGWQVTVRPLAAALHNRPQHIKSNAERLVEAAQASGAKAVLAYADCGTYGALDDLATQAGVSRLPGLHCYDLYAGPQAIEQLFAEQPGTYLLTDYLIKSWQRSVIEPLGLDRHPELWTDYFAHYTRLVWLAQEPTPDLEAEATRIAQQFNLPLTCVPTGTRRLEEALAPLIEPPL